VNTKEELALRVSGCFALGIATSEGGPPKQHPTFGLDEVPFSKR